MKEGLYRIHFAAQSQVAGFGEPRGSGVVYLRGGIVAGGDDTFYFAGGYQLDGLKLTVKAQVKRHTQNQTRSIFGTDTNAVTLSGSTDVDGQIRGIGETSNGIRFQVSLHWLAD